MLTRFSLLVAMCLWMLLETASLSAAVVKIEVTQREPYDNGRVFGQIGAYERVRGKVHFAVDPNHAANKTVIDLELAPHNSAGLVEFSADVEWLAPRDLSKANGSLIYEVNNRGKKNAPDQFNTGAEDFLFHKGFTLVWSGWIAETQPGSGRLRLQAPVATNNGTPITGLVRTEVVVDAPVQRHSLAMWDHQGSYEPTERGEKEALLTSRLCERDSRVVVPRDQWHLEKHVVEADGEKGQLPHIDLVVDGGLQAGRIYEVVYEARGPVVQGLGLAGIRDLVSFLKNQADETNPLWNKATRSNSAQFFYGFGVSQSGRCLRQFLYDGFNQDELGRQVFHGVIPQVAGAGLGFFNHRFASPTRHNGQHDNHLFPADQFPFTYGVSRDPLTGREDGILHRDQARGTVPKVMHTQSSSEYWHRAGSLVHTDPLGTQDAVLPPEVRVYCFGGTQHGPGRGVPAAAPDSGQLIGNPADYRPLMRALLMALDEWVRTGKEPPASVYPRHSDGTLVGWRIAESGWQPIPGVPYPEVIQQPEHLDRGAEFLTRRIATKEPPDSLGKYVVKVPACGWDNNERGTLQVPAVAVPIGTYTSWNLRTKSLGAENELLGLKGGFIPFAKTQRDRQRSGDPRPALFERYRDFDEYTRQYRSAVDLLLEGRYILKEDVPALMKLANQFRFAFE